MRRALRARAYKSTRELRLCSHAPCKTPSSARPRAELGARRVADGGGTGGHGGQSPRHRHLAGAPRPAPRAAPRAPPHLSASTSPTPEAESFSLRGMLERVPNEWISSIGHGQGPTQLRPPRRRRTDGRRRRAPRPLQTTPRMARASRSCCATPRRGSGARGAGLTST